jgi:hypothetical protein
MLMGVTSAAMKMIALKLAGEERCRAITLPRPIRGSVATASGSAAPNQ